MRRTGLPVDELPGSILVDDKGFALYTYAKDTKDHSTVNGQLLSYWPAL